MRRLSNYQEQTQMAGIIQSNPPSTGEIGWKLQGYGFESVDQAKFVSRSLILGGVNGERRYQCQNLHVSSTIGE